jgi:cell division protein ZapB
MEDQQYKSISSKIDDLIDLCGQLEHENRSLKHTAGGWHKEREQLVAKTEMARDKVESMITRLKALEQGS